MGAVLTRMLTHGPSFASKYTSIHLKRGPHRFTVLKFSQQEEDLGVFEEMEGGLHSVQNF